MVDAAGFRRSVRSAIAAENWVELDEFVRNGLEWLNDNPGELLRTAALIQSTGLNSLLGIFSHLKPSSYGESLAKRDWVLLQEFCLRKMGASYPDENGWVSDKYITEFSEIIGYKKYIEVNPLEYALENWNQIINSGRFIDINEFEQLIVNKVKNVEPFSFIRIGDGEGRFIDSQYPQELKNRIDFIAENVWFWNSSSFPDHEFFEIFVNSCKNSDVLGLNPANRIKFEFFNSLMGYVGVLEGNKFGLNSPDVNYVENSITVPLDNKKFIDKLISDSGSVVFISPNTDFQSRFDLSEVKVNYFELTPENNIAMKGVGSSIPHYPQLFDQVCKKIRTHGPDLYIVGGGIFGKIYCEMVKRVGGIALDFGSLLDLWAGRRTR